MTYISHSLHPRMGPGGIECSVYLNFSHVHDSIPLPHLISILSLVYSLSTGRVPATLYPHPDISFVWFYILYKLYALSGSIIHPVPLTGLSHAQLYSLSGSFL